MVKGLLRGEGRLLHAAVGVAEEDWAYTKEDLAEMAGPLTRVCNRYIPHLAKYADPAVLAAALMSYATRSLQERQAVIAASQPDPGTRPIPPAEPPDEEAAPAPVPPQGGEVPTPEPPAGTPTPRAASSFPSSERPSPQEADPQNAPPPPQPADVDAADPEIRWEL